jgi:hypothetical protein
MASEKVILELYCNLEKIFGEYSFWAREMLVFTVSGVRGRTAVIERFKKTADNIADGFRPYYASSVCGVIGGLYRERTLLIIEIARSYTYENTALYGQAVELLERNGSDISAYFFDVNQAYDRETVLVFLRKNADYIIEQVKRRFAGEFEIEINYFDSCYTNMIDMADYISEIVEKTVLN